MNRTLDRAIVKRTVDILTACLGLIAAAPVLLIAAIGIVATAGFPVVFQQQRLGFRNRVFTIRKLRTMTDRTGPDGSLLPDSERLTRWGAMLRRYSIDELPQLWNVLVGEMSLVGPRPLITTYGDRYSPEQKRRHDVKPGITGWAQINGRNNITWERKFAFDVWYVDNRCTRLDLYILLQTVMKVLRSDGFSDDPETEFHGIGTGQLTDANS